jgi:hypothetical protein
MSMLLADPLGRALLSLLTTDFGLPGDPRRKVLLRVLQELRATAEAQGALAQVKGAIRSALWSLRAEFPAAYSCTPAIYTIAVADGDVALPAACIHC